MNNSILKNEALFARMKKLVATERRIGVEILECLYEIERRKAYAELREGSVPYDGLYTYCIKELGFTDSQAYQRIQAMRALKEIPELKPMIESGSLSVSSVAKVQNHFRKEKKEGVVHRKPEKLELYRAMENCTSREVDRKLAEVKGEKPKVKLVLEMDEELEALWKRVKDLSAHRSRGDESEALKIIAREWLHKNDPLEKAAQKSKKPEVQNESHPGSKPTEHPESQCTVPLSTRAHRSEIRKEESPAQEDIQTGSGPGFKIASRFVSSELRKKIWYRDRGKCVRCGSTHALEIDHILPFAAGGETTEDNLRLVCRSCNRFLAVKSFGTEGMRAG